jgi:hypothetical protein
MLDWEESNVRHHELSRFAATLGIALCLAGTASGSGSYSGRPSQAAASIDRPSYELGKKVFAGQFTRTDRAAESVSQAELLESLQRQLPLKARTHVELASYAGQLDDEQLAALQYFLKKRYKVELRHPGPASARGTSR